jgi:molybdopterin-containing oxidoreductase family iron-sulfur binding subunit
VSPRQPLPILQDAPVDLAPDRAEPGVDPERRAFMRTAAASAALAALAGCKGLTVEDFFRRHFKELTGPELKRVLAKVEASNKATYGRDTTVTAEGPRDGVEFGYGLDLSRCIGCRRCVYACVKENNQSRQHPQIHWIRVLEMDKEHGVDLTHAEHYYDPATVPQPGKFYFPVQCQQCRNPPCVKACPTQATWKEKDGIVVIDYDWCIGCRCCMSACPYGARHFNLAEPTLPAAELNPSQHFLGNRPRPKGVVEKCTFCIQRSRQGRYTACVEICPVGARKFGNLLDPESEIRRVMETKRVFIFKEELATHPQFYYFYAT